MKILSRIPFFIFLLSTSLCFSQSAFQIENQIDNIFKDYNSTTPGVAVAVVKNGEIIFKKGYGIANMEYTIPITPKTVFNIGSVSKQFTTFAIYLLEKQGKISLNDDVRKYIPELPLYENVITIKHLCSHTSGIKDQWSLLTLAGWRMDDVITQEQVLKIATKQKQLNFISGSSFQYSNTGFTLLTEIVKRVSGKSFSEFAKEHIFNPLGMESTFVNDDNDKIVKNVAYPYANENGFFKKNNWNNSSVGGTNVYSTVEDLSKWTLNFENPVIGDIEFIENFNQQSHLDNGEPVVLAVRDGDTIYHAKGQFMRNYKGINVYNHTGSHAGYKSYLGRFQDEKLSIILLSNDENFVSYNTGLDISGFYLKNDTKETRESTATQTQILSKPEKFTTNISEFEGSYYSSELTTSYDIENKNGKLVMSHRRLNDIDLTQEGDNKFSGRIWFDVELEFVRGSSNEIIGFDISNFGAKNVRFKKQTNYSDNKNSIAMKLIQAQLTAYNSRNIDAFILPYGENIEIFNFPDNLYGSGIEFLKDNYKKNLF